MTKCSNLKMPDFKKIHLQMQDPIIPGRIITYPIIPDPEMPDCVMPDPEMPDP